MKDSMDRLKLDNLAFFYQYVRCSIDSRFYGHVNNQKNAFCSF